MWNAIDFYFLIVSLTFVTFSLFLSVTPTILTPARTKSGPVSHLPHHCVPPIPLLLLCPFPRFLTTPLTICLSTTTAPITRPLGTSASSRPAEVATFTLRQALVQAPPPGEVSVGVLSRLGRGAHPALRVWSRWSALTSPTTIELHRRLRVRMIMLCGSWAVCSGT